MKFWLLLLLSAVIAEGSVLDIISPKAWTRLTDFSKKTGYSLDRLEVNMQKTVETASNIRGAAGIVEDIFVSQNLITKIRFPDGRSWAAKWGQFVHAHEIFAGINSLVFLENCCPNIPIAKQKGWNSENDFIFYFTEWTEGTPLNDLVYRASTDTASAENLSEGFIPPQIIASLAEFVFNISLCTIPTAACIQP
jgi:hypothetical protein